MHGRHEIGSLRHQARQFVRAQIDMHPRLQAERLSHVAHERRVDHSLDLLALYRVGAIGQAATRQLQRGVMPPIARCQHHLQASHAADVAGPARILFHVVRARAAPGRVIGQRELALDDLASQMRRLPLAKIRHGGSQG